MKTGLLVAALAGICTVTLLVVHPVPPALVRIFDDRAESALAVRGGLRLVYDVPAGTAVDRVAANLVERAGARGVVADAHSDGGALLLDLPGTTGADAKRFSELLAGQGRLALQLVDDGSAWTRTITDHARHDPRAAALGVRDRDDAWTDDRGESHRDTFLEAEDRHALETYLAETASVDPALAPPTGDQVVFEHGGRRAPGFWRTYTLHGRVELDGAAVVDAIAQRDRYSDRPVVMLTLDPASARLFGDLTAANAGHKLAILVDGEVMSVPVIESGIYGGHIQITMGSDSDRQGEAERLAGALRAGPLPPGMILTSIDELPPLVSAKTLNGARGLAGLAVALLVAILLWLGGKITTWIPAAASGENAAPWLRLLVTLAAPALVYLASVKVIILPGGAADPATPPSLGVFALGILPVLSAFWLVDFVAFVVPRWRRLRNHGPDGRAKLAVATAVMTVIVAAVQAWFVTVWMASAGLIERGLWPQLLVAGTLVGGVLCYVVLAALASRFGLTAGWSAVIFGGYATTVVAAIRGAGPLRVQETTLVAAGAALIVCLTVWMLRRRARGYRLPTSGTIPLEMAPALLALVAALSPLGLDIPPPILDLLATPHVQLAVALVLCVGLSCLFARGWPGAGIVVSAAYLGAIFGVHALTHSQVSLIDVSPPALAGMTAIAMDAVSDWRARRRLGELVEVWPLHRVHRGDAILAALAAAGIDGHLRGAHHRSLLHAFAPFVPVAVMVPAERAALARQVVGELLAG